MGWRRKKPGYIDSIEHVEGRCLTESSKEMVRAYHRLLKTRPGVLPAFRDLDLADVRHAAPYIALCSVGFGKHCTIRFFGDGLRQRIGVNPVGRNFFDFVHPERAENIRQVMEMLVRYPCAYLARVRQEFTSGRTIIVETVAFPLASSRPEDDGQVILTDTPIGDAESALDRNRALLSADVVQRDLIDLGFGVDEDFEDLVSDRSGPDGPGAAESTKSPPAGYRRPF